MLFALDGEASQFIRVRGGAAVIEVEFRACLSDGLLAGRRLAGCFVPTVRLGDPADTAGPCERTRLDGIILYHPADVRPKPGRRTIRIVGKSFLFWRWLELEDARAVPVFDADG